MVTDDTTPSSQLFGIFGQAGSTSNTGISCDCVLLCAAPAISQWKTAETARQMSRAKPARFFKMLAPLRKYFANLHGLERNPQPEFHDSRRQDGCRQQVGPSRPHVPRRDAVGIEHVVGVHARGRPHALEPE